MRKTILFIILISTKIVCGQTDSVSTAKWYDKDPIDWISPKNEYYSNVCLKFAPLSLLGIYTGPSIRLGTEYKIKDCWALYNELGYFIGNRGILTKIELKNYIDGLSKTVGAYVSAELVYKYQSYSAMDSIQGTMTYNKDYSVSKHVECLTIKYGYLLVYKHGFVIDAFIGAGIRLKQAQNTLTNEENSHLKHSSDYGPNVLTNEAGNKIYPNIDIGVKIGYRIK